MTEDQITLAASLSTMLDPDVSHHQTAVAVQQWVNALRYEVKHNNRHSALSLVQSVIEELIEGENYHRDNDVGGES
jgi:hypothetical protein